MKKMLWTRMTVFFALLAITGCNLGPNYSTPQTKVYKVENHESSTIFTVDFVNWGRKGDDATLSIRRNAQGKFDINLGVEFKYTKTDVIMRNGEILDTIRDGRGS